MKELLHVSASPHVRSKNTTQKIMFAVILALLPAAICGVWEFGWYSFLVLLVSVGFAVLSEYVYETCTGRKVTISDGSAALTGLLLGLNMPPEIPLWIPMLGSIFAIIVVKQLFGGLGQNFMNPALAARCFLLISFTEKMTTFGTVDALTTATPLSALKSGSEVDVVFRFADFIPGTIGEVSAIALAVGGIALVLCGIISWIIPVIYTLSFAVFVIFFGGRGFDVNFLLVHLCGGGLMLGAWFMATDYVTSPITNGGKAIYAVILGVLTGIFRLFGGSAEGVSYAILFGNLLVPLIEKVTLPKSFGWEGRKNGKM